MTATVPEAMKPLEVEKNVQMQALSKFNTAMAKVKILKICKWAQAFYTCAA